MKTKSKPSRNSPKTLEASELAAANNQNLVTSFRWAWYALSGTVPFAGIFIALMLFDQDSREVRKVGRNCLFIGFLIWIVFPLVVLMGLLLVGAAALFSFVSDMMPTD